METLRSLMSIDPDHALFQSEAYIALSEFQESADQALHCLTLAIRLNQRGSSRAYAERGKLYRQLQQHESAAADFETSLQLEPDQPAVKRLLAQSRRTLLSQLGQGRQRHGGGLQQMPGLDLYGLLGVGSSASTEEIRAAFQAKASDFHPDKHASATQEQRRAMERKLKAMSRQVL